VPSQNQGTTEPVLGAIRDVVVQFMNTPSMTSAAAATALASGVQAAK